MIKMQRCLPLFLILTVVLLLSCATSQTGMYGEDESAYVSDDDEWASSGTDEDDVLRLLGLTDATTTPAPEPAPAAAKPADSRDLRSEVSRLEGTVAAKDRELTALREQLNLKDSLIKSKEQNLEQARSAPRTAYSPSFRARYDDALRLYYARRYREAIAAFDELIRQGGDDSLVDNCQYWKGESYYGLGNFEQAIIEFQKVFTYSNSNKLDDAQLKLGLCYLKLGNSERARREFQKLINEFPNSEYVGRAQSYLR